MAARLGLVLGFYGPAGFRLGGDALRSTGGFRAPDKNAATGSRNGHGDNEPGSPYIASRNPTPGESGGRTSRRRYGDSPRGTFRASSGRHQAAGLGGSPPADTSSRRGAELCHARRVADHSRRIRDAAGA